MSLTYSGAEPQPSLAWTFESSNVDIVTGLAPSSQVSPGPAQLLGSAVLTNTAPTSNTAVYFPGTSGSYMLLNSTPATFDLATSNLFVECWVYFNSLATQYQCIVADGPTGSGASQECWIIRINPSNTVDFIINAPAIKTATSSTTITTGQWYHIAASYNSGSSTAYVFVNGGTPNSVASVTPKTSTGASFTIGAYPSPSSGVYMNAYIRDLRVVQGGVVPTTSFTPGSAPFSYTLPSYVTGSGSVVFTLLGQFVTYVPGKYNQSLRLMNTLATPSQNYLQYTYPAAFDTFTGMTICFWMKMGKLQGTNTFIFQGNRWYAIVDSASKVEFVMINNAGTYRPTNINAVLVVDTWYHFAYTSINGVVSAYINGSLGVTRSDASTQGVSSETSLGIASTAPGVDGSFDDLRIYNTALTAAQVQSVYSSQGAPVPSRAMPLPQLAWDFNGTTTDYVSGVTPLYSGSAQTYGAGKYLQSAVFTNPVATSDTPTYYQFYATSGAFQSSVGFTISFWFNQSNKTCLSSYQSIIGFNSTVNSYYNDIIVLPGSNGIIGFYGQNPSGSGIGLSIPSSVNAVVGTWYHVAFVMRTGGTTMYLNGNQYGTGTYPNEFTISELRISSTAQYTGHAFCGSVDDLRIFDRALTSAQVQSIYNQQGVPGRGALVPQSPQPSLMWQFESSNVDSVTQLAPTTTVGTPTYVAGKYGQAINFPNSTSTGVSMATNYSIYSVSLNSSTGYTFAFWVKFNVGGIFAQVILSLANSSGVRIVNIYLNGSNQFVSYDNGSDLTVTSPTLNTGTWYHVAISITTSSRVLYLNGVGTSGTSAVTGTQTSFILGGDLPSRGNFSAWCSYDDLRVFNTALTAAQVQAIYGTSGMPSRQVLSGTSLFSQLSSGATSSAVGAFSLRAVNGTSVKAVAVQAHPVVQWPPVALTTNPNTLSSQTYGNGTYTISATATTNGTLYNPFSYVTNGYIYWSSPATYIASGAYTGSNVTATSYFGEWLQIQLPTSITLKTYSVRGRPDATEQTPRTWYIFGSSDGSTWTLLDTQTSVSWPSSGTTLQTFTPSSTTVSYLYFRFVVNAIGTSGYSPPASISQWILNASSPSYAPNAAQDFYADRLGNLLTAPVVGQSLASWLGGATGYVTTWYDQSGQGQHMAQSTASLQPLISLATSPPSILFTGNGTTSGQYFQNTIPFTFNFGTNYQYTIRAVVNNTVGGVLVYKGKQGAPWNGNGEKAWYLGPSSLTSTSGNYPDLVGFAEGWVITSTPITSSKTSVTWASSSFSSVAVYENASSVTPSYTRASQLTDASNYLYFGITTASGVPYYNGNIYEIEIFSTPLSASDVTIMG